MDPLELLDSFITIVGDFTEFVWETGKSVRGFWHRFGLFLKQCEFIGVSSLGMITVAAVFLGAVLGRAGAAMAAEIASMRVSEQIDALEVMAVDPIEFLVMPRIFAGVTMMPLLSVYFGLVGSVASAVIACGVMGMDSSVFWHNYSWVVDPIELIHCVIKGAAFGLVLTWVACFCGFRARGGARAVGFATRSTVVASLLTILLSDYLLTSLLPYGFATLKVKGI